MNAWTRVLIVCLMFFVFPNNKADALSCAKVDGHKERLKAFGGAVYGKVVQVKADSKQNGLVGTKEYATYILVDVERSWSLNVPSQIIVATDFTWGFPFETGRSYLFYAKQQGGELVNSPCSPVQEIQSFAQIDPQFGEGNPPTEHVNVAHRMWFMTVKDYDMVILAGMMIVLLLGVRWYILRRRRNDHK